jgi:hypothetical protein
MSFFFNTKMSDVSARKLGVIKGVLSRVLIKGVFEEWLSRFPSDKHSLAKDSLWHHLVRCEDDVVYASVTAWIEKNHVDAQFIHFEGHEGWFFPFEGDAVKTKKEFPEFF